MQQYYFVSDKVCNKKYSLINKSKICKGCESMRCEGIIALHNDMAYKVPTEDYIIYYDLSFYKVALLDGMGIT